MNAYLDNAASTRVLTKVWDAMHPYFVEYYGNPSSHHAPGMIARKAVESARQTISHLIGADSDELFFTSGGTEADYFALAGTCLKAPSGRRHIIASAIEHKAILSTIEQLKQNGFSVTILPPDADGIITPESIAAAMRADTFLVSIMMVNNEIGTIQPLQEIGAMLKPRGILFHSDAIQAFGKIPVNVQKLNVDLLSLSGHKLHGPKGVGALFVRRGITMKPLVPGGGQENGLRSGTENVPSIVGFAKASEIAVKGLERTAKKIKRLRTMLETSILSQLPGSRLVTSSKYRSPFITNIIFPMVDRDFLLARLGVAGIYVTSGSACASYSLAPSHVLIAMGVPENMARNAIRFSLSSLTTESEIKHAVRSIVKIVEPFVITGLTNA
ncbi:MAG TPA: cysteine desulfurase family protein [Verrucomicrobiae bacterium]|nr:cysteine desulfurase family protein [Verrucomicrobiae bacterium]